MLSFLESVDSIWNQVQSIWQNIVDMFSDVDFTILYNWLPSDVQAVCTAVLAAMIVLALIGLLKRAILFLG